MNAIETHVLRLIGENVDSPDVFTEGSDDFEQIRGSINDGIKELAISLGFYRTTYQLPLLDGRGFYRMSWPAKGFLYVVEAFDRLNNRKLEQTTLKILDETQPKWMEHQGFPTNYLTIGHDMVGIYPKPSGTGKVIELICIAIPAAYTESTSPKIREAHQRAAAYYAVSEYYASRGDAPRAKQYYEDYISLGGLEKVRSSMPETSVELKGGYGNQSHRFNRQT